MKDHFMAQTLIHKHSKKVSVNNNIPLLGTNIIRTVYHFNGLLFIKLMWYKIGTFNN